MPEHVCPWWVGYLLVSPLRRLMENPERLLAPHVRPGMKVVEPGPGMGFFTLPLARLVGESGLVTAVDLEPRMLAALERRARKKGLAARIQTRLAGANGPGLGGLEASQDLAVVIHMLHEVPDQAGFLRGIAAALRPGGRLILREPKGHVSPESFTASLELAQAAGLTPLESEGLNALLAKAPA